MARGGAILPFRVVEQEPGGPMVVQQQRTGRQGALLFMAGVTALSLAGLLVSATPSEAQGTASAARGSVSGTVRDGEGRAITGAQVSVLGGTAAGESDEFGAFRVANVPLGQASMLVRRIGFAPETLNVLVDVGGGRAHHLDLTRVAPPLAPILILGRRDVKGVMAGFYARLERGQGRFLTREQIDRSTARRMSDLLRGIPGLRIDQRRFGTQTYRMRGSPIAPLVWLDGIPMGSSEVDLDNFDPRTFAGIEIYSGAATVPVEFSGGRSMSTSGGTILLWTREGQHAPRRRKKDEPTAAAVLAGLIARDQAFTRDQVDTQARPIGPSLIVPVYPDSLYAARLPGHVEVEFVVDATGKPLMDTFGIVAATYFALGEAVRRAVEERRFIPATRNGQAVAQVVQQPFAFVPDSSGPGARKPQD